MALLAFLGWTPAASAEDCTAGPAQSAAANAASLSTMPLAVFHRAETGWAIYEPLVANEIGTECAAVTAGFAHALAMWQGVHGLGASGILNAATLEKMKAIWQSRRPLLLEIRRHCPDPPPDFELATAHTDESYGGKLIQLRSDALAAYRTMFMAAQSQGIVSARNHLLTIFSAYRSPAYDAARCATQHNCNGVERATCSPHRTGYAMDLYLGAAPGYAPDSSADVNRLYLSQSSAYQWLVRNGARFGLVNYPLEPWHWEYVGKAPLR